ncbi:MAG: aminoacyl-tRNA hydrolase [Patescibacteria group bacterium]
MTFMIVGLGNPGPEYKETRHNTGRLVLEHWRAAQSWPEWKFSAQTKALESRGRIGDETVTLLLPEGMMNKSGQSLKALAGKKKSLAQTIVVYDDLDLPFGKIKISFNRSSGGHRGLESVIKAVKSQEFIRLRVGIGLKKKPADVVKFILGRFTPAERVKLKKIIPAATQALEQIIERGWLRAQV